MFVYNAVLDVHRKVYIAWEQVNQDHESQPASATYIFYFIMPSVESFKCGC